MFSLPLNKREKEIRDQFPFITKHTEKIDQIEKLHIQFCELILGVH